MQICFDPTGTTAGLQRCLDQVAAAPGVSGLLVLCADENNFSPEQLDPLLQNATLPLAGGIFPAIIQDTALHKRGSLVVGLPDVVSMQTVHNLSDHTVNYENVLEQQLHSSNRVRTLILFVDGFATRVYAFIESLFNIFGLEFNYVGGGAGSLSMKRGHYILTNTGMVADAAILAFLGTESGIGVSHGWQELAGPYQVTSSESNLIRSIEWQPAYSFYSNVLEQTAGVKVTMDDFFTVAKHHPFGIARLSGEQIVRDPYAVENDGSLVCIGEVQEGAFLSILKADDKHLIQAAADSLQVGLEAFPTDKRPGLRFFVDCISRVIVLDDEFHKELEAVYSSEFPLIGVCSIGEIANCGTEYLELYNKTSVMAVLEDDE